MFVLVIELRACALFPPDLYLSFVRNARFVSATTLPSIQFMVNCLVELYSLDTATAYQHAFIYIRQVLSNVLCGHIITSTQPCP